MKRLLTIAMLTMSLGGTPFLVGCDKEVAHDETVKKNSDGTVSKDETTVNQKPDGTIVKEHEQSKN
ncbi:MAG: hypothetical protein JO353_11605 [Phycisphaerae bacterium]|nr:hypothetical protein [Phycisphaerae bacterium]